MLVRVECQSSHQTKNQSIGPAEQTQAHLLARRLDLPPVEPDQPWADGEIRLRYQQGILQAVAADEAGTQMTVAVDYLDRATTRRRQRATGEMLIKALQGRQRQPLTILDVTAGLAADAMLIAAAGHHIMALERSPIVSELVKDGIRRVGEDDNFPVPEFYCAEAENWLMAQPRRFDVIYMDPMFAPTGKKALPRKNLQLLRRLCGDSQEAERLLALAKTRADCRVVVKRHVKADYLGGLPDYSIKGQRVRFDIYQTC